MIKATYIASKGNAADTLRRAMDQAAEIEGAAKSRVSKLRDELAGKLLSLRGRIKERAFRQGLAKAEAVLFETVSSLSRR